MARVYKTEIYITDYNDVFQNIDHLKEELKDIFEGELCIEIASIKSSDRFEWKDNLKINYLDSTVEDFEEYFK